MNDRDKAIEAALARLAERNRGKQQANNNRRPYITDDRELTPAEQRIANTKTLKNSSKASQRLNRAIASHHRHIAIAAKMIATASKKNSLQLTVEMLLLPLDKANGNRQAVPASEKDNILMTALHCPIRAAFDKAIAGHDNAVDIGVITDVWMANNAIYGKGAIWRERNESIAEYLLNHDTYGSFEIYYGRSELVNGVEYLYDTVFAAHAMVASPAYGHEAYVKPV